MVKVFVGATDMVAAGRLYNEGQQTFQLQRGQRGTAMVTLIVAAGDTYSTAVGEPVTIQEVTAGPTTTTAFYGTVDHKEITVLSEDGLHLEILTCVSGEQQFDTLRVTPPRSYFGHTAGYIVNDLLVNVCAGSGITAGTISAGATIPSLVLDTDIVSDVFNSLAKQSGFIWYVDPSTKTLNFCPETTTPVAFTLASTDTLWTTEDYQEFRSNYRNRQSVRVNFAAFYDSNEIFAGDGMTTTFTLRTLVAAGVSALITTSIRSRATCTFSGIPTAGDIVTVNDAPYVFVAAASLDNTQLVEVVIAGTIAGNVQNLADAINGNDATRGTAYSWPTWENDACNADGVGSTSFTLNVKWAGSAGDGHICTTTSSVIAFTDAYTNPTTTTKDGQDGSVQQLSFSSSAAAGGQQSLTYTRGSADVVCSFAPATGTFLSVEYQRLGGDVITVEDTAQVAIRAAIEGGTGKYQDEVDDSSNASARSGLLEAQGLLAQFGNIPKQFTFSTFKPGISAGQYLTVLLTFPTGLTTLLNGNWVVQEVQATLLPGTAKLTTNIGHYQYTVMVVDQPNVQTYVDVLTATVPDVKGNMKGTDNPVPVLPIGASNKRAKIQGVQATGANVLKTPYKVILPPGTIENIASVTVVAQVAPATQDYLADVLLSTDDGVTWNSIFIAGAGNQVTLPIGSLSATIIPAATNANNRGWAIPVMHNGDQLQISVLQADGTVSGVEITVSGRLAVGV